MAEHPRRIAILGAYGTGNLGDELVLESLLRLLRRAYPGAEVRAFAEDPELTSAYHGIATLPIEPYRPARKALSWAMRGELSSLRQGLAARRATDRLLEWTDLLVLGGGNLLTDHPAYFLEHYVGQIARRAVGKGVPLAVLGVGASPVNTRRGWNLLARLAEAWASTLAVREEAAADLLRKAGAEVVEVTGDPVLLSPPPAVLGPCVGEGPIGLSLRPTIQEGGSPAFAVELVAALSHRGALRPLALHPAQDVPVLRSVLPPGEVVPPAGPGEIAVQVAGCRCLVSMRLHTLILGAGLGMPAVGLAYHAKVERFARWLGTFPSVDILAQRSAGELVEEVVRLLQEQEEGSPAERRARVEILRTEGLAAFQRALARLPFAPPLPLDPDAHG